MLADHHANLNAAKAVGRSDLYLKCQLLNEGVCILFLLATFRVSVEAIAYGMLITNVVTQILDAQLNKKLIGYGYLEQMRDILPTCCWQRARACACIWSFSCTCRIC